MKQFLVEVFAPRSRAEELRTAEGRAKAATERVSCEDADIRYLRAIYVPQDETCFYVFEASSAELVAQASVLAGLGDVRIVETFAGSSPPLQRNADDARPREVKGEKR